MKTKVSQFEGKKNQFLVETDKGIMFQSYDSPIAFVERETRQVHLSEHYDYSATTMKYLNHFLGHNIEVTRANLESGKYKLDLSLNGEIESQS